MEFIQIDWDLCEDTGQLFAVLSHTDAETHVDALSLKDAMQGNGYDGFFMEAGAIEGLLRQADNKATGRVAVAKRMDAEVSIAVTSDSMQAMVTTQPSFGGQEITKERLRDALDAHEIAFSICDPQAVEQVLSGKTVTGLLLARGTGAQSGRGSRFVPLVDSVVDVPLTEDETGRVDFRQILEFTSVEAGTPLMRLDPPRAGGNGSDVYGRAIPAETGPALSFPSSVPGAVVDPEDPGLLIAEISGHPVVRDDCVQVDPILTLDAVDVATGNVEFDGSVLIKGDVAAGSSVNVTGDIVIKGIVEKATISAGRSIEIDGGVFGREVDEGVDHVESDDNEHVDEDSELAARLTAGGDISAKFMSHALVSAAKVVSVREYIAHCNVRGKQGVWLGQQGGKGCVIGGRCRSDREVVVNVLGTHANVPTLVVVGYRPKLRRRYRELKEQLMRLVEEHGLLEQALAREQAEDDAAEPQKPRRVGSALDLWDGDIARIGKEVARIGARIEALEDAKVVVKQRIYPNTRLKVNGRNMKIKSIRGPGCYVREGDAIEALRA